MGKAWWTVFVFYVDKCFHFSGEWYLGKEWFKTFYLLTIKVFFSLHRIAHFFATSGKCFVKTETTE